MTKKQKISNIKSSIRMLEKKYSETGNIDIRDRLIRKRRELASLEGYSTQQNNIFSSNFNVYYNETGKGLTGQH